MNHGANPGLPDMSLLGLFLQADPVVKGVMILLLVASVAVWAIALDRWVRLAALRRSAARLDALARSRGARPDGREGELAGRVLAAGRAALPDLHGDARPERRARIREAMRLALADALLPVQPGLPFLATVGSAGPFVGLFGTVWGIMNSFSAIARSGDTSLAAVAPGIAEALAATAVGLAAAIPAVMLYNRLATMLGGVRQTAIGAIARLSDQWADEAAAAPHAAGGGLRRPVAAAE